MDHVAANIGGAIQTRKTYDQEGPVYEFVPAETQRRALDFLGRRLSILRRGWCLKRS